MGTRGSVTSLRRSRFWKMVAMLGGMAVIASVGITACHDEVLAPADQLSTLAKHPQSVFGALTRKNIGAYHNEYLDFAFPRVVEAVAGGADRAKVCKAVAKAMREFVVAKKLRRDGSGISDGIGGAYCADLEPTSKNKPRYSLASDGVPIPALESLVEEMAIAVAENRSIPDLQGFLSDRVAYARANFPPEEADAAEATASVALSSAQYWDANYEPQEQAIRAAMEGAYSRSAPDDALLLPRFALFQAPSTPLNSWLDRIRNHPWYPNARKVGGADIEGAIRGALGGVGGGPGGMLEGALIRGAAESAIGLIRIATQ